MHGFLSLISGLAPPNDKQINIELQGKNLIVTGPNGCGKTAFLSSLYEKITRQIVKRELADGDSKRDLLSQAKKNLGLHKAGSSGYASQINYINGLEENLKSFSEGVWPTIDGFLEFYELFASRKAIIRFFPAGRMAKITHADTAKGIDIAKGEYQKDRLESQAEKNFGSDLEQHLVNLKNRSSLAITEDKDEAGAQKINKWFSDFESNLKKLLEDDSAKLLFNSNQLKFSIAQQGKKPYTFQQLSSGYTAIFDIYADLLMRTEFFDVTPSELRGIVIIDELDAHLHVSLQRLILPFFEEAFPKIQFIVSTHSPFILMSATNSVVYDMGSNTASDVDLSFYSYSAVMEALLATKPVSVKLQEVITEVALLANSDVSNDNKRLNKLKALVSKLDENQVMLSSENRAFLEIGRRAILNAEDKSV